uniref:Uncharacterized protein n=1 Tax=Ditylenchus dipsaci TaxID=166011 RepID=A0A915DX98_9BILA
MSLKLVSRSSLAQVVEIQGILFGSYSSSCIFIEETGPEEEFPLTSIAVSSSSFCMDPGASAFLCKAFS